MCVCVRVCVCVILVHLNVPFFTKFLLDTPILDKNGLICHNGMQHRLLFSGTKMNPSPTDAVFRVVCLRSLTDSDEAAQIQNPELSLNAADLFLAAYFKQVFSCILAADPCPSKRWG